MQPNDKQDVQSGKYSSILMDLFSAPKEKNMALNAHDINDLLDYLMKRAEFDKSSRFKASVVLAWGFTEKNKNELKPYKHDQFTPEEEPAHLVSFATDLPGCTSGKDFINKFAESMLGIPKQTISLMAKVGTVYLNTPRERLTYGISDEDCYRNQTKLSIQPEVSKVIGEEPSWQKFKELTYREYKALIPPKEATSTAKSQQKTATKKKKVHPEELIPISPHEAEIINMKKKGFYPHLIEVPSVAFGDRVMDRIKADREKTKALILDERPITDPSSFDKILEGCNSAYSVIHRIKMYLEQGTPARAAIAIGIYRLASERILVNQWKNKPHSSLKGYIEEHLNGYHLKLSWYKRIGRALVEHGKMIKLVFHFSPESVLYKLAYLDSALKKHSGNEDQVYRNLNVLSYREFVKFAKGEQSFEPEPVAAVSPKVYDSLCDDRARIRYIERFSDGIPYIFPLHDMEEIALVNRYVSKVGYEYREEQKQAGQETKTA